MLARAYARLGHLALNFYDLVPLYCERLLDDHVLAVPRREAELLRMLVGIARDIDDVNVGIREHRLELRMHRYGTTVTGAQFAGIQRAGGEDRGDLGLARGVDGADMCGRRPAVADDPNVVFL